MDAADKIPIELPKDFASWKDLFQFAAKQAGNEKLATYAAKLACTESGLGASPYNTAPGSTVSGLTHFKKSTWDGMVKQYGEDSDTSFGLTTDGKRDALQGAVAAVLLAKTNAEMLKPILGRDPTDGELSLAHQLGTEGAKTFFNAYMEDKNAPATEHVSPATVKSNSTLFPTDANGNPATLQQVLALKTLQFEAKYNQPSYYSEQKILNKQSGI